MWHRERSLAWRCVLLALGAVALGSGGAGAVLPGTVLSDGRGYQLVSPASKNGGRVGDVSIAPDGSRVEFLVAQGPSSGSAALFLAHSTGTGWVSSSIMPPADQLLFGGAYSQSGQTPGLSAFFFVAHPGLFPPFPGSLVRLDGSGGQSVLASFPPDTVPLSSMVLSPTDGSRAYTAVREPFDPDHVPGTPNVYDFGSGSPVLVSRLPDGSVPACGVGGTGGGQGFSDNLIHSSVVQHWVSVDGSRVFFLSPGDVCDGSQPAQLYMRDLSAGTTTLISGPAVAGADADATFLGANAAGTQAVYVTAARLTADDTNTDPDVYRYTTGAGGGNECLTCLAADANVAVSQGTGGGGVAVSEDLSRVYFTSENQLVAGKGAVGAENVYVWHKDPANSAVDRIDWVASGLFPTLFNNPTVSAALTPDGHVLVFTSRDPGMDALTPGQTNAGFLEVYRYDDDPQDPTAGVRCLSCPNGTPTVDTSGPPIATTHDTKIMSDDGNTIFFRTPEPLSAQDVNGTDDLYEWRDNQIHLISDGVTPQLLVNADQLVGTTTTGNDVFTTSFTHYTSDVIDNSNQLYDAKIGATPLPKPPIPCTGEACQGPLTTPPLLSDAATATYSGSGNTHTPTARIGIAHITTHQTRTFAKTGRLTLAIGLTQPGKITITAHGTIHHHTHTLAKTARTTHHPGVIHITLHLTTTARHQLTHHHPLHLTITIHYNKTPTPHHITLTLKPAPTHHT